MTPALFFLALLPPLIAIAAITIRTCQHITAASRDAQGNACAICGTQDPGKRGWHIDHDHSCCPGKTSCGLCVRGLLCSRCNIGLGFFLDNINALRAAEAYLERADASATFGDTPRED